MIFNINNFLPTIVDIFGVKSHWLDNKLHRLDGPAVEYANGDREWYQNNKLHRENGPAREYADDYMEWWLKGVRIK